MTPAKRKEQTCGKLTFLALRGLAPSPPLAQTTLDLLPNEPTDVWSSVRLTELLLQRHAGILGLHKRIEGCRFVDQRRCPIVSSMRGDEPLIPFLQ